MLFDHNTDKKPHEILLTPTNMGKTPIKNRVIMAPLTRSRSVHPENTQTPLHALYYSQRAEAGLIISEATQISQAGQGYAWTPGIHSDEQVESWKLITESVHVKGGRIFCQLWHVGAISHNVFQPDNQPPKSSSDFLPEGDAFVGDILEDGPTVPHPQAKAMTLNDIEKLKQQYKQAALNAKKAGFDGVELHAGNGYLLDQFIRSSVNKRDDQYGGSIENRIRLVIELVDILSETLGAQFVGVRISPYGGAGGSHDDNPTETYTALAKALSNKNLAYLHAIRPNAYTSPVDDKEEGSILLKKIGKAYGGFFIANGDFTPEEAAQWIKNNDAHAVSFGRLYLANPDLIERIKSDGPYNEDDSDTHYAAGSKGYTDYPTLNATHSALED